MLLKCHVAFPKGVPTSEQRKKPHPIWQLAGNPCPCLGKLKRRRISVFFAGGQKKDLPGKKHIYVKARVLL